MPASMEVTKTLQSLLRGEMSAVETYRQALERVKDEPGATELRAIERDHRAAVEELRMKIMGTGEKPATSSGVWGSFAAAVEGTSKLFGSVAALRALKEGEEHGAHEYEEALEDEHLDPECRKLISDRLFRQRGHIPVLHRLIALV